MKIILTIVILLILLFIARRIFLSSKGVLRSADELKRSLSELLKFGLENGVLIITPQGTKSFVQFNKYINKNSKSGLEFSFPKAEWSEVYFEKLTSLCEAEGIDYSINKSNDKHMEFVDIDFGENINNAHEFIITVFNKVFETKSNSRFHVLFYNLKID